jgi:hypothetical protein
MSSLQRALDQGFGIETDIRDLASQLVISHDPPSLDSKVPPLDWLFKYLSLNKKTKRIALNIKADGLAEKVCELLRCHNVNEDTLFAFDMSVPDSLSYIKNNIPTYSRVSEYESEPACLHAIRGIWIDNFTGTFPQVTSAQSFLARGFRTALVSSELHGRDNRELWTEISNSGIYKHPLFELCTDFPNQAAEVFSISEEHD